MMLNMLCNMWCEVGEPGIIIPNPRHKNTSLIDSHMAPDTHGNGNRKYGDRTENKITVCIAMGGQPYDSVPCLSPTSIILLGEGS